MSLENTPRPDKRPHVDAPSARVAQAIETINAPKVSAPLPKPPLNGTKASVTRTEYDELYRYCEVLIKEADKRREMAEQEASRVNAEATRARAETERARADVTSARNELHLLRERGTQLEKQSIAQADQLTLLESENAKISEKAYHQSVKIAQLEAALTQTQTQLSSAREKYAQLRQEWQAIERSYNESAEQNVALEKKVAIQTEQLQVYKAETQHNRAENSTLRDLCNQTQKKLEDREKALGQALADLRDLEAGSAVLKNQLSLIKADALRTQDELEKTRHHREQELRKLKAAEMALSQASSERENLEKTLASEIEKSKAAKSDWTALRAQLDRTLAEKSELEKTSSLRSAQLTVRQAEVVGLRGEIENGIKNLKAAQEMIAKVTQEKIHLEKIIALQSEQIQKVESECGRAYLQATETQKNFDAHTSEWKEMQAEVIKLRAEAAKNSEALASLQEDYARVSSQNGILAADIQSKFEQILSLEAEVERSDREAAETREDNIALQKIYKKTAEALRDAEKALEPKPKRKSAPKPSPEPTL